MAKESNYVLSGGVSMNVEPKDYVLDEYDFNDGFEKNNSKSIDNIMYFLTSISNALNEHFTDSPMLIQNYSYENEINNQNQLKDNIKKEIEQNAQEREEKLKRISDSKKQQREKAKLNSAIKNAIDNKNKNSISKINVPTLGLGFSYKQINSDINEPLIKKQQRNQVKKYNENLEKLQNRADIFYGTDEEYFKKFTQNNSHNYNNPVKKEITKQTLPDISNPDKLLFPEGKTLADMPMKKINTLSEYEDTQTQISDEIDRYINEIENTEITLENGNKVFVKKLMPNIKQYFSVNNTKDNNINSLQRFITDMRLLCKVAIITQEIVNKNLFPNNPPITIQELINSLLWDDISNKIIKTNLFLYERKGVFKYFSKLINNPTEFMRDFIANVSEEEIKEMLQDYIYGGELSQKVASIFLGEDAAHITRITSQNANLYTKYTKNSNIYNSPDELPYKFQQVIKDKLKSQNLNLKSKGILFYSNSEIAKRLIQNKELKNKLKENIKNINIYCNYNNYANKNEINNFSIKLEEKNFYYAIKKADIINLKLDIFGNVSGDLIDTTDYNENDKDKLVKTAHILQVEGNIVPKFIIIHFVIPLNNLI